MARTGGRRCRRHRRGGGARRCGRTTAELIETNDLMEVEGWVVDAEKEEEEDEEEEGHAIMKCRT